MEDFQRPPLAPLVKEEISQSMHEIDQRYWPLIIEFRRARFIPPDVPVPPERPLQLLEAFRSYATELFDAEAGRYGPFRAEPLHAIWLSNLATRISVRIQEVFSKLEEGDPESTLFAHGVNGLRLDGIVNQALSGLIRRYVQQGGEPQKQIGPPEAATADKSPSKRPEREALRDAHRAAFPDVKIADILWVAKQTRREWTR